MEETNSDYSSDDSDGSFDFSTECKSATQFHIILTVATAMSLNNDSRHLHKRPCMTSTHTGDKWVGELLLGHPMRFHNMFRMSQHIFLDLINLLESNHGLHGSKRTTIREVLGITLYILAHNESVRATCERFQHSTETISRYFSIGLQALVHLGMDIIRPTDKHFLDIPSTIRNDDRYMPFFKDCIGAIDGTHIDARVPIEEQVAYIGRHHSPTQNVMAVCDFNMCFTFIAPGWEGLAHDARIFQHAVMDRRNNFPMPPLGKFYLVDAGYSQQRGFLKPYPETRYHLPDFVRGTRPIRGAREIFNKTHSSLRSVIERSFGVWKKKWGILRDMPNYSFKKQRLIVVATMTLHNYIRRHWSKSDPEFEACDADEYFIHPEAHEYKVGEQLYKSSIEQCDSNMINGEGAEEMTKLRDDIAMQLELQLQ